MHGSVGWQSLEKVGFASGSRGANRRRKAKLDKHTCIYKPCIYTQLHLQQQEPPPGVHQVQTQAVVRVARQCTQA